ncbi:MAG: hypothetical protein V3T31_04060 [candidate division Zixibacteria bacterium]
MFRNSSHLFILVALISILGFTVSAHVPQLISYQGRLTDSGGAPLDTTVSIVFTIYDDSTGGTSKWTETQSSVTSVDGLFDVLLGSVNPLTDTVFADTVRYLGITVGTDSELIPRARLVSVAYAHRVATVDGATGGTISGDVAIASDLDLDGDLRVTGKATIGTGHTNTGADAFVAGVGNSATGPTSTISGGGANLANSDLATISGGASNQALGHSSTIGGGAFNMALGNLSTVGGGGRNLAEGDYSVIAGGGAAFPSDSQVASGDYSSIGGGRFNIAMSDYSRVGGGTDNIAAGYASTVGGGVLNIASGSSATVPGGNLNSATQSYSFAAGRQAQANHIGSFVWSDSSNTDFASTADNQFLIRAGGGVGIGTDNPLSMLHIKSSTGTGDIIVESNVGVRGFLKSFNTFSWLGTETNHELLIGSNGTGHIWVKTNGRIGIDEPNPTRELDVNGSIEMNGFSMPTGASNGYVLTSSASGIGTWQAAASGGITGSGTTNYLPRFSGSSTLANSVVYQSGSDIGIGDTSPSEKLDVTGKIRASDGIRTGDAATGDGIRFGSKASGAADISPIVTCYSGYIWWDYSTRELKLVETNAGNGYCHYIVGKNEGAGMTWSSGFIGSSATKILATLDANGECATVEVSSEASNGGYIKLYALYSNNKMVTHYSYRYE